MEGNHGSRGKAQDTYDSCSSAGGERSHQEVHVKVVVYQSRRKYQLETIRDLLDIVGLGFCQGVVSKGLLTEIYRLIKVAQKIH